MKSIQVIVSLMLIVIMNSCISDEGGSVDNQIQRAKIDSLNAVLHEQALVIERLLQDKANLISSVDSVKSETTSNELYGDIVPIQLEEYTYVEILNLIDTSFSFWSKPSDIQVSIYQCGNGPSDPNKDYCNGSYNLYVGTLQPDLPPTTNLFEVGPFVDLKIDSVNEQTSLLYFHHDNNGVNKKEVLHVTLDKVSL